MAFRILTFNINGRHRQFRKPPFLTFTSEKAEFWKKFEHEIDWTRDANGISRVKRAIYDQFLILVNENEEINSDMWLHVETVDISNQGGSEVNPSSDLVSNNVIFEAYIFMDNHRQTEKCEQFMQFS